MTATRVGTVRGGASAGGGARLRLMRRGRLALIVLPGVLSVIGLFVAVVVPAAAATSAPRPTRSLVVQAGSTLWNLAERVAPHRDPRDVIAELQRVNHLEGAGVRAGMRLVVPVDIDR